MTYDWEYAPLFLVTCVVWSLDVGALGTLYPDWGQRLHDAADAQTPGSASA